MTEPLAWALWGASVVITAAALGLLWVRDSAANDDDTAEMVPLDELMERGSQDDATAEELLRWGLLHDIAVSPLVAARAAIEEHEPLTWEQRRRVFGTRIREQRRRLRLIGDATQQFEAIADEAGFPVSEHGPVEPLRQVWDADSETWVKDTARQLPLPLRGLRPIRGAR